MDIDLDSSVELKRGRRFRRLFSMGLSGNKTPFAKNVIKTIGDIYIDELNSLH